MREKVHTDKAPRAIGPYSQAIDTGDFVFLSGQIGLDPETGQMKAGVEEQTHQVMRNLQAVLETVGLDFSHVVKTTIYLQDLNDFQKVNEIYASYLQEPYPARATVQVAALPKGALVEIEMIAKRC